jgi:hypothetical protein
MALVITGACRQRKNLNGGCSIIPVKLQFAHWRMLAAKSGMLAVNWGVLAANWGMLVVNWGVLAVNWGMLAVNGACWLLIGACWLLTGACWLQGMLALEEVRRRVQQFAAEGLPLVVTRCPLFVHKADLMPGSRFVVGFDTVRRTTTVCSR